DVHRRDTEAAEEILPCLSLRPLCLSGERSLGFHLCRVQLHVMLRSILIGLSKSQQLILTKRPGKESHVGWHSCIVQTRHDVQRGIARVVGDPERRWAGGLWGGWGARRAASSAAAGPAASPTAG